MEDKTTTKRKQSSLETFFSKRSTITKPKPNDDNQGNEGYFSLDSTPSAVAQNAYFDDAKENSIRFESHPGPSSSADSNLETPSEVAQTAYFDDAKEKSLSFESHPGPSSAASNLETPSEVAKTAHFDDAKEKSLSFESHPGPESSAASNLETPSEVAKTAHFDDAKEKSLSFESHPGPSSAASNHKTPSEVAQTTCFDDGKEKSVGFEICSGPSSSADFPTAPSKEYDIGTFIENIGKLDDFTKQMILVRHWNPPQGYRFPSSIQKGSGGKIWHRRPSLDLFTKFPWLVFSKSQQGLYCRYCPLFLSSLTAGGVNLQRLVVKPVTDFRKLLGKDGCLVQHENHVYHKKAVESGKQFLVRVQSPQLSVRNMQDKGHLKQVEENRKMLLSMVKCILFLGKQNIPFRGHRDDGSIVDGIQTQNEGNFRELVRFCIDSGDNNLSKHLQSACANAMYSSKTIQNELINCCGNEVRDVIIDRIKAAKYYSILFDETTDAAHESQITFSARYCYKGNVYEDFLDFVDPRSNIDAVEEEEEDNSTNKDYAIEPSLTGEVLGSAVLNLMKKNNLDLENCVGIASDGCSTMVSEVKGAVNAVQRYAVNATHCPCLNHALNLTLTKASKIQDVRNAIDIIKTVIAFFTISPKRNSVLKQKLGRQLIGLCQTRWVERHDSVHLFCSSLPKIHEALLVVSTWKESEASTKAHSLSISISTSAFLVSLASLADILAITLPLSRLLQKKIIDQKEASDALRSTFSTIEQRRLECDEFFHYVYLVAEGLAQDIDTELSLPRIARRQQNRPNPNIDEPEAFYRTTIYIPIVDTILQDIKDRFHKDIMKLFELSIMIPTMVVKVTPRDLRESTEVLFSKFQFAIGNISSFNRAVFSNEVALWQSKWIQQNTKNEVLPNTAIETLTNCDKEIYPAVYELTQIFSTLPVSTATAERSFSTLRRLKDFMRTSMSEERLVALALLNIHREIADKIDLKNIVDKFANVKKRKLNFIV